MRVTLMLDTTSAQEKMTFRRSRNKYESWKNHCRKHQNLVSELKLSTRPFENEQNFRDFTTYGNLNHNGSELFNFNTLNDSLFWELHEFITTFFELDMGSFVAFEQERTNRQ